MYHWSPRGSLLFHSSLFQYFLLSSVFRILIIMESWLGFLWVYPVCDSLSFLNLEVYVFCQISEVSGHYFFKYFFSPIFSPFPDSDNTNVNFFCYCPLSLKLCSLFCQPTFSLLFTVGNFHWSVFKFTDSFLCHLWSTIEPS